MRIAIVNDVQIAMEALVRIINASQHKIAWCAWNGAEAIKLCEKDTPDVVLMDLFMPQMNGVDAIRNIMKNCPCPVLIVTASIERHSDIVFEAMGAGALDVVTTPQLHGDSQFQSATILLRKIDLIGLLGTHNLRIEEKSASYIPRNTARQHLVVIGSSSGGPDALARLLSLLPADYPSPIVVIQHIDAQFAAALAKWLNDKTQLRVEVACNGNTPMAGHVYIAASNEHLVMNSNRRLYYSVEPRETSYRPSVDVFFNSVADHWGDSITAVLLTGMGQDGAQGLLTLRELGAQTIAQDESTAAVFGMPKIAAEIGAAQQVLPIDAIPAVLCAASKHATTMSMK